MCETATAAKWAAAVSEPGRPPSREVQSEFLDSNFWADLRGVASNGIRKDVNYDGIMVQLKQSNTVCV